LLITHIRHPPPISTLFPYTTLFRSVVQRIRQVGVDRVVYGSDAPSGGNAQPREGWAAFRRLPLSAVEFDRIARNVAPYLHCRKRSEEHTSELQSLAYLVCRLLLEKK